MASEVEKQEKQERAERLKLARERAQISGPKGVFDATNGAVGIDTYKAHEAGRNGYSVSDGRLYAELFGVPLTWLYLGMGTAEDAELPGASMELRQAFARVIDAPADVQEQVIKFIGFQLSQFQTPLPQSPAQPRGQSERASARRVKAP